ncbi:hypothetical protein J7M22_01990 [Candidatus Poribacteria bacterium]|nr:hypothetical protein [Candidatus Poribacteria bacterium]HDO76655.1 hypothetical protein [Candidatus Poribacteria bacterium]HEX30260.1 hypothetical protein [Candidatus Poribacteria bacterium]
MGDLKEREIEERIDREVKKEIVDIYQDLIDEIWTRIAPILGTLSLKAIMDRAVSITSREFSFMSSIEVTEEGVCLERLKEEIKSNHGRQLLKEGFKRLIVNLFHILARLTGKILINRLLQEINGLKELTEGEV